MATILKQLNPRNDVFWDALDPTDHSVQIYGDEPAFMDALAGYVRSGLRNDESVIVIATAVHIHDLEKRLRQSWIDIDRARWEERFVALLASETLSRFMVNGIPDEARFVEVAQGVLQRARGKGGRKVRAFGEMVALLWADGQCTAAIALERLWNQLQAAERFPLFCAYPHSGFKEDDADSLLSVCATHSRVIPGYA
jgi:hypothetical protein